MSKFADKVGHEWQISLDVALVQEVKDELGVNLTIVAANDMSWSEKLDTNPGLMVSVLHILLADQVSELNLNPKGFASRFDGPTLGRVSKALMEAICDFFPRPRIAGALRENLPKLMEIAEDRAIAKLARIVSTASTSATSSPESAESIPEG